MRQAVLGQGWRAAAAMLLATTGAAGQSPATSAAPGFVPLLAVVEGTPAAPTAPAVPEKKALPAVTARLRLARGHAAISLATRVAIGKDDTEYLQSIGLPEGGAATGLALERAGGAGWWSGQRLPADKAYERFWGKDTAPEAGTHERALLSWQSGGGLNLQILGLASDQPRRVELTAICPVSYEQGADVLRIGASPVADAEFSFEARGEGQDRVRVSGAEALPGGRWRLVAGQQAELTLDREAPPRLGGRLALVPLANHRAFWSHRVEAAARLSRNPVGAQVVVLIDASRSLDPADLQAERQLAAAYLSHLPDARVHVAFFDRTLRPLGDGLTSRDDALARLSQARIDLRNGSAVDLALAHARRLLDEAPGNRPKRILLLTDTRTRSSLRDARLTQLMVDSGALVHVATVVSRRGETSLSRDDEHLWAHHARSSGGLFWWARTAAPDSQSLRDLAEELVRPVRLDRLVWSLPGLTEKAADPVISGFPVTLAEGEGQGLTSVIGVTPGSLRVEGELWAEKIRLELHPDAAESRRAAAFAAATSVSGDASEADLIALANLGGAVSPYHSLLAESPGPHPSPGGGGMSTSGGSRCGCGGFGTHHGGDVGTFSRDHHELIDRLRAAWRRCSPGGGSGVVAVETSFREIVDIPSIELDGADPGARACLEQAAWAIELPASFLVAFQRVEVRLGATAPR